MSPYIVMMKHGKDHKRRIQDDNHLNNVHDGCLKFVYLKKADNTVKTKKHRKKYAKILSYHSDFKKSYVFGKGGNDKCAQQHSQGWPRFFDDSRDTTFF